MALQLERDYLREQRRAYKERQHELEKQWQNKRDSIENLYVVNDDDDDDVFMMNANDCSDVVKLLTLTPIICLCVCVCVCQLP